MVYIVYFTAKDIEGLRVFTTRNKAEKWIRVYGALLDYSNIQATLTNVDKEP